MDFGKSSIKYSPCKPPIDCSAYADDEYDPCEKTQEITDQDLAVLSKEEKVKKAEQGEQIKAGLNIKEGEQLKAGVNVKGEQLKAGVNVKGEQLKAGDKDGGKAVETEDSSKAEAVGDFSTEEGEKNKTGSCKKKPNCRKVKRNPFFTNRLNFSSDLPPRPATPPPQFFPPVEDENVKRCTKRKKKCTRRKGDRKYGDGRGSKDGMDGRDGRDGQDGRDGRDGRDGPDGRDGRDGLDGQDGDDKNKDLCVCTGVEDETCDPTTCLTYGSDDDKYRRRKCPKKKNRPPCRKKSSDISISLQPRKIPALQKDLPERCPKEEAIMERKLPLLCVVECLTKNCRKTKKSV